MYIFYPIRYICVECIYIEYIYIPIYIPYSLRIPYSYLYSLYIYTLLSPLHSLSTYLTFTLSLYLTLALSCAYIPDPHLGGRLSSDRYIHTWLSPYIPHTHLYSLSMYTLLSPFHSLALYVPSAHLYSLYIFPTLTFACVYIRYTYIHVCVCDTHTHMYITLWDAA